jgi:NMD protein affecting ribosome stability and mRNA decay
MASKHLLCSKCFKARYETINKMKDGISFQCEHCPKCGDIILTHKQSLELDRLRREKADDKKRSN